MNEQVRNTTDSEVIHSGLPAIQDASLAVALARAEVDQQIATARALPRSIQRAVNNIMTLATLDDESAEECVYALPRGGKPIKGPSIRLAEIIASQWGNCRVGARVVHVDRFEKYVEAEGVFHDLETNTATTSRVRRRISDSKGRLYSDDMIVVTGNAACAIAKRNAILGAVPKAVWRKTYAQVEAVIAGDVKTLAERRDLALKAFAAFGVTPERIFEALEIAGADDLNLDHLTTLTGMRSALKSGESTVEEMFPAKPTAPTGARTTDDKLDDLAKGGASKAQAQKPNTAAEPSTGAREAANDSASGRSSAGPTSSGPAPSHDADGVVHDDGDEARDGVGAASPAPDAKPARGVQGRRPASPPQDDAPKAKDAAPAPAQHEESPPAAEQDRATPAQPERTPAPATVARGPKVGEDLERDAATLADLRQEAERRANEGSAALAEFEEGVADSDYETELLSPFVVALRRTARAADKAAKAAAGGA